MSESSRRSVDEILDGADTFFLKKGSIHRTLRRLTERLAHEGIDYALVGGLALNLHGYVRMTTDVDLILTREGLVRFRDRLVGRGYLALFPGAEKSFRDVETNVVIEVLTTGEYPGDGEPKPVRFGDPATIAEEREGLQVIRLEKLIEIKLASGLSASHRLRDLADVQDLIRIRQLPLEAAEELDSSVRDEYRRLWYAVSESKSNSPE